MGLAQSALILLGIGIVSSRFKAGVGLGELGTGIQTLVAAPLTGTGTGLSAFSGGLRDLAETLGDLGRGFSALFESIPKLPGTTPGNGNGQQLESLPIYTVRQPLIPDSGGSTNTLLAGGGGSVVRGPDITLTPQPSLPIRRIPRPGPDIITRPIDIYTRDRPVMM